MSLTKLSLAGVNYSRRESLVSDVPAEEEKIANLLQCIACERLKYVAFEILYIYKQLVIYYFIKNTSLRNSAYKGTSIVGTKQ